MRTDQDSPNGGASVQDVMSAWIVYALLFAALAVCAFAFDFTASVADRDVDRLASPPPLVQPADEKPAMAPENQRYFTQQGLPVPTEP